MEKEKVERKEWVRERNKIKIQKREREGRDVRLFDFCSNREPERKHHE
jgi:hypothetical protein